jgi:hypothetical protein
LLRLDPRDDLLGFFHQRVEFRAAPDGAPPEPLEELAQVLDGRISEHLGLAVV